MKKLKEKFSKNCFIYKQIKRTKNKAIYEVWLQSEYNLCPLTKEEGDAFLQYEVIYIKKRKAIEIYKVKYPPMEVYPGSSEWGNLGWSFNYLKDANEKYANLA